MRGIYLAVVRVSFIFILIPKFEIQIKLKELPFKFKNEHSN
jgi:hypothetical protein